MLHPKNSPDFNKSADVVSCFIQSEDEMLLLQRQPHKSAGNKWGPPAGKVEANESLNLAMVREIFEETGLTLTENRLNYFSSVNARHGDFDFEYHMFWVALDERPDIKLNTQEHQNFTWVSLRQALKMNLVEDQDECTKMFLYSKKDILLN